MMHWHVEEWCDGQVSIHELDIETGATGEPIAWMEVGPYALSNAQAMCDLFNEMHARKQSIVDEAEREAGWSMSA